MRSATRLCRSRQVVQIEISDTGPGNPEKCCKQALARYFSTKRQGTGLGLSLAQRVIADHHSTVVPTETHAVSGVTCRIELPIA